MRITNIAVVAVIVAAVHPGASHRASACRFRYPSLEEKFAGADVVFLGEIVSWVEEPGSSFLHIRVHVIEAWKGIAAREIGIWAQRGSSCSISFSAGLQIFHFGRIGSVNGQIWTGMWAMRRHREVDELARLGYAPLELVDGPDPSFPLPSDCNGNGVGDAHDIAGETSADCNDNGIPDECEGPALLDIAGGSGAAPNTFISPRASHVPLDSFVLDVSEDVDLVSSFTTSMNQAEAPSVVALLADNGVGRYTVVLSAGIPPGEWTRITLRVRSRRTCLEGTLCLSVAHLPDDINQDGRVDIRDATAFGVEWRDGQSAILLDLNGDGVVDLRDATAFGASWRGDDSGRESNGTVLEPASPCP